MKFAVSMLLGLVSAEISYSNDLAPDLCINGNVNWVHCTAADESVSYCLDDADNWESSLTDDQKTVYNSDDKVCSDTSGAVDMYLFRYNVNDNDVCGTSDPNYILGADGTETEYQVTLDFTSNALLEGKTCAYYVTSEAGTPAFATTSASDAETGDYFVSFLEYNLNHLEAVDADDDLIPAQSQTFANLGSMDNFDDQVIPALTGSELGDTVDTPLSAPEVAYPDYELIADSSEAGYIDPTDGLTDAEIYGDYSAGWGLPSQGTIDHTQYDTYKSFGTAGQGEILDGADHTPDVSQRTQLVLLTALADLGSGSVVLDFQMGELVSVTWMALQEWEGESAIKLGAAAATLLGIATLF